MVFIFHLFDMNDFNFFKTSWIKIPKYLFINIYNTDQVTKYVLFMNYVSTYVWLYFLTIILSVFFQGPDWQYRTELPAWAKDNWVDPDSL